MKEFIKKVLGELGYAIVPNNYITPADLREVTDDPREAHYLASPRSFLINANVTDCVVQLRFSSGKKDGNPYVLSVMKYLQNGSLNYHGSPLEHYYSTFQPSNVKELFFLEEQLHDDLETLNPNYFIYPFEKGSMAGKKKFREKYARQETNCRGKELGLEHGTGLMGPISEERGKLEIKTLISLTNSIQIEGYQRNDEPEGDIKVAVLIEPDGGFRYLIKDGVHRLTVLSALGYEKITLRVEPTVMPSFIYRQEVEFWPNVISGLYTKRQALKIFDTMFAAKGQYSNK